jgi:hypothetical protein
MAPSGHPSYIAALLPPSILEHAVTEVPKSYATSYI